MQLLEEIPLTETGILPDLVNAYLRGDKALQSLYQYQPAIDSFRQAIADRQQEDTARELLADVLEEQYADLATSASVKNNIDRLRQRNTFTVTAAHQPCLFLGPLYNIWKIAGAIHLSIALQKAYPDYHFVPVFWMGTEDHDIAEVNHTYVNGERLEWEREASGAVGRVASSIVRPLLDKLSALVGEKAIVQSLHTAIDSYATIGKLTQWLVNELFKHYGLIVLDQDHAALKSRMVSVMSDEIFHQRATGVLADRLTFLQEKYKVQAQPREINFFYLGEGFRERIIYNSEAEIFEVNHRGLTFTPQEMAREINTRPERFSPNVIFRPLYQEMLLPNLAFIGGSGELSYWLELKPLFEYYHINYPVLLQRNSAAILSASVLNKLHKLGLNASSFFGDTEQLVKEYVKAHTAVDTSLESEKQQIEQMFEQIAAKAAQIDGTLKQSAAAEKQKVLNSISNVEAKMLKAEKRNQETVVNQIWAVHEALFPRHELQERSENFLAFYEPGFIDFAVAQMSPLENSFKILA